MPRMKSLKTFRVGDTGAMVEPGQEFETKITSYEARGMAVPVGKVAAKRLGVKLKMNKAASAGPLASPGGKTGAMTSQSLSPAGRARKPRRSRNAEGTLV